MICSTCNEYIRHGEMTSQGPDGYSHAACAKRMTAHPKSIDLLEAFDEIGRLKQRVQELERQVEHHNRSIDFKIG